MKHILLVLIFLMALKSFGQNANSISKIILQYDKGGSSWGRPGIYSKGETIEISVLNKSSFRITKHLLINSIARDSGKIFGKDTVLLDKRNYPPISKQIIDSLFTQLKTSKDNFNIAFIKPQLKKPSKQQIIQTAGLIDEKFKFEDRDDVKPSVLKIQSFAKLDSFINLNKPNIHSEMVVIDAWDNLTIKVVCLKDTLYFRSKFQKLLGQPFNQRNVLLGTANLEINSLISALLPRSSLLLKAIEINALTEKYIEWYIDKVL